MVFISGVTTAVPRAPSDDSATARLKILEDHIRGLRHPRYRCEYFFMTIARYSIAGLVFGQCMGDAVGLATEFLRKPQALAQYSALLGERTYKHSDRLANFHCARWPIGAFTDDSDQMIMVLQATLDAPDLRADPHNFLRRLSSWCRHGFVDPGSKTLIKRAMGIGATVHSVVECDALNRRNAFMSPDTSKALDAFEAARMVWKKSGGTLAANGAVMRTSILAVPQFWDLPTVFANTLAVSKTTHYDPRCSASCVAVTSVLARMLQSAVTTGAVDASAEAIAKLVALAESDALAVFASEHERLVATGDYPPPPATTPFSQYDPAVARTELTAALHTVDITALGLDNDASLGYTFQCLAGAFGCLNSGKSFVPAICDLTLEAGDADTNCAVAGALLGCKLGYSRLMDEVKSLGWENMTCLDELLLPALNELVRRMLACDDVKALIAASV